MSVSSRLSALVNTANPTANSVPFLKYGDIISLDVTAGKIGRTAFRGTISAEGHTDRNLIAVPRDTKQYVDFAGCLFEVLPIISYEIAERMRQLVEQKKNQRIRQLSKRKSTSFTSKRKESSDFANENTTLDKINIQNVYEYAKAKLQEELERENESNQKTLAKKRGTFVQYGGSVMLRHIASGKAIAILNEPSEIPSRVKMCVQSAITAGSFFSLVPIFKTRRHGDRVEYGDQLHFKKQNSDLVMSVSTQRTRASFDSLLPDSMRGRAIINASAKRLNVGGVIPRPYSPFKTDEQGMLRGGSVVKIFYPRTDCMMKAAMNDSRVLLEHTGSSYSLWRVELEDNTKGGVLQWHYMREYSDSVSDPFRLRNCATGKYLCVKGRRAGLHASKELDNIVWDEVDSTAMEPVLLLEDPSDPDKPGKYDPKKWAYMRKNTLFKLRSTKFENNLKIHANITANIQVARSDITATSEGGQKVYYIAEEHQVNLLHDNDDVGHTTASHVGVLDPDDTRHLHDFSFTLRPVAEFETRELGIVVSGRTRLQAFLRGLQDAARRDDRNSTALEAQAEGLVGLLDHLIAFILDTDEFDIHSADPKTGKALMWRCNRQRQREFIEQGLVECLVDVLAWSWFHKNAKANISEPGVFDLEKAKTGDTMISMCQRIYLLIMYSFKDDRELEIKVATEKNMDIFFQQSSLTEAYNDMWVEQTITQLLTNNIELLQKIDTDARAKQLTKLLQTHRKDQQLPDLLTGMCSCQGQAVSTNQEAISAWLFSPDNRPELFQALPKLHMDKVAMVHFNYYSSRQEYDEAREGKEYYIGDYIPANNAVGPNRKSKPMKLVEFLMDEGAPKHMHRYFLAMLRLYAEVSWSRNYLAIRGRMAQDAAGSKKRLSWNGLKEVLPLVVLLDILNSGSYYSFAVRAACTRLIQTVHLDCFPWQPISVPYLNREWRPAAKDSNGRTAMDIEETNLFAHVGEAHQNLVRSRLRSNISAFKQFAVKYLRDITADGPMQYADNEDQNMFTLRIMELVRHMLTIGLFRTKEDIVNLAKPVIAVLDGRLDTATQSDNKKLKENPEVYAHLRETRFVLNERTKIIMDCKVEACYVLLRISDITLNLKLQLFVGYYQAKVRDVKPITKAANMIRTVLSRRTTDHDESWVGQQEFSATKKKVLRDEAGECVHLVFNNPIVREIDTRQRDEEASDDPKEKTLSGRNKIMQFQKETELLNLETQLLQVLLDLTSYHYIPLVNAAFTLLLRRFSSKTNALRCARKRLLIIEDKHIKINRQGGSWLEQLKLIAEAMEAFEMELLQEANPFRRRVSISSPLAPITPLESPPLESKTTADETAQNVDAIMRTRSGRRAQSLLVSERKITWERFRALLEAYGVCDSGADTKTVADGIGDLYRRRWTELHGTAAEGEMKMKTADCFGVLMHFVRARMAQLSAVCRCQEKREILLDMHETSRISIVEALLASSPVVSNEGAVDQEGQILLRNLGVVEVGNMFLSLHRGDSRFENFVLDGRSPSHLNNQATFHINSILKIRRSIYRLLSDMCTDNKKMQKYVFANVMDNLMDDLGRGVEAGETISTIFRNNYKLSYELPQRFLDICARKAAGQNRDAFLVVLDVATSCNGRKIYHQLAPVVRILRDHYGPRLQEVVSDIYGAVLLENNTIKEETEFEQKVRDRSYTEDLLTEEAHELAGKLREDGMAEEDALFVLQTPREDDNLFFDHGSASAGASATAGSPNRRVPRPSQLAIPLHEENEAMILDSNGLRLLRIMGNCGGEPDAKMFFQQLIDEPCGRHHRNVMAGRASEWMKLTSSVFKNQDRAYLPVQESLLNFLLSVYMNDASIQLIATADMASLITQVTSMITFDLLDVSRPMANFTFRVALPFLLAAISSQFVDSSPVIVLGPARDEVDIQTKKLLAASKSLQLAARTNTEKHLVLELMSLCGADAPIHRSMTHQALNRVPQHRKSDSYVLIRVEGGTTPTPAHAYAGNKTVPVDGRAREQAPSINAQFQEWVKDWGSSPNCNNPEMYNICQREIKKLADLYTKKLEEEPRSNDAVASLVKLVHINDVNLSRRLSVQALRIFRQMVEGANEHAPAEPAAKWRDDDPDKSWLDFSDKIESRQNMLAKRNVVPMLVNVMTNSEHKSVREEALLVALSMLLGGNGNVQDLFLEHFRQEQEFKFFSYLRNIIRGGVQALEEPSLADPAAQFDKELKAAVEKAKDHFTQTTFVMRFMQLLCEGQNQPLAKYLANQKFAPRSVDLISETVFLIRALKPESFETDEVVEMSKKGLDFLYECIQGPCEINQKLLVDRKVTEALKIVFETATGTHYLTNKPKREELLECAGDAVQICIGLIEGDKAALDYPFTSLVVHNINFEFVIKIVVEGYKHAKQAEAGHHAIGSLGYPGLTIYGFHAYNLLATIASNSDFGAELIQQAWEKVNNTIEEVLLEDFGVSELKARDEGLESLSGDEFCDLLGILHHTDYADIAKDKNIDGADFAIMEEEEFQKLVVDAEVMHGKIRERLQKRATRIYYQIRSQFPVTRPRRPCWYYCCREQNKRIVVDYSSLTEDAGKFYTSRTLSIEVVNKNNVLERVHFPKLPVCDSLSKDAKFNFNYHVDRSSSHVKVRAFFQEFRALLLRMENVHKLQTSACLCCYKVLPTLHTVNFVMMLLLNVVMIAEPFTFIEDRTKKMPGELWFNPFHYNHQSNFEKIEVDPLDHFGIPAVTANDLDGLLSVSHWTTENVIRSMLFRLVAFVLLVLLIITLSITVFAEGPLIAQLAWNRRERNKKKEEDNNIFTQIVEKLVNQADQYDDTNDEMTQVPRCRATCYVLQKSVVYLRIIYIFIVAAALACPWVSCLLLFDVCFRIKVLKTVLQACTKNKWMLISTGILLSLVTIVLSVIYFAVFPDDFVYGDNAEPICTSLGSCVYFAFNNGIRSDAGLGAELYTYYEQTHYRTGNAYFGRFLIDMVWYFAINTILLQIFFGIIVDTFAGIREERNQTDRDQLDNCFICGLPSSTLNFKGNGFEHHTRSEHNMWSYFFYYVYLQRKHSTEYTPIEDFVNDCCSRHEDQVKWFPEHQALAVSVDDDGQAFRDNISGAMSGICNNQKNIMQSIRTLSANVSEIRQELSELQEMHARRNRRPSMASTPPGLPGVAPAPPVAPPTGPHMSPLNRDHPVISDRLGRFRIT